MEQERLDTTGRLRRDYSYDYLVPDEFMAEGKFREVCGQECSFYLGGGVVRRHPQKIRP